MINFTYTLINSEVTPSSIYQTTNLELMIHEYLSCINNELAILCKYGIKLDKNRLKFDNLYFIGRELIDDPKKKYDLSYKVYRFNIDTLILSNGLDLYMANWTGSKDYNKELISTIESRYDTLVNSLLEEDVEEDVDERDGIADLITGYMPNLSKIDKEGVKNRDKDTVRLLGIKDDISKDIKTLEASIVKQQLVEEVKADLNKVDENFVQECSNLHSEKKMLKNLKDKEEEKLRVFEADKKVYTMLKKEIKDGMLDENKISPLFVNKFCIFEYLDTNSILNKECEFDVYIEMLKVLLEEDKDISKENIQGDVPHSLFTNTNNARTFIPPTLYDNDKEKLEQKKYLDIIKKENSRTLNSVLDTLSSSDDENYLESNTSNNNNNNISSNVSV